MNAAVELDDESSIVAIEIGDEGPELLLSPEFQIQEFAAPNQSPQDLFSRRLVLP